MFFNDVWYMSPKQGRQHALYTTAVSIAWGSQVSRGPTMIGDVVQAYRAVHAGNTSQAGMLQSNSSSSLWLSTANYWPAATFYGLLDHV